MKAFRSSEEYLEPQEQHMLLDLLQLSVNELGTLERLIAGPLPTKQHWLDSFQEMLLAMLQHLMYPILLSYWHFLTKRKEIGMN